MVEIFKTNIYSVEDARHIQLMMRKQFPGCEVNFDLDDCDKIMRVKGTNIPVKEILDLVITNGILCEMLR